MKEIFTVETQKGSMFILERENNYRKRKEKFIIPNFFPLLGEKIEITFHEYHYLKEKIIYNGEVMFSLLDIERRREINLANYWCFSDLINSLKWKKDGKKEREMFSINKTLIEFALNNQGKEWNLERLTNLILQKEGIRITEGIFIQFCKRRTGILRAISCK